MAKRTSVGSLLDAKTVIALGVSLGAGMATGAQASAPVAPSDATGAELSGRNEVLVQEIDGRLFFSERGGAFRELPLGDGGAAAALRAMLRANAPEGGPVSVDVGRTVVADGGTGWHQDPPKDDPKDKK